MLTAIEGVYRNGHVELLEKTEEPEESRVIVTFLSTNGRETGMPNLSAAEAAELRWKLSSFEEDWNAPGMEAYDEP